MRKKVYIKAFKMPENCHECPFAKWEWAWCTCIVDGKEKAEVKEGRPNTCKLAYLFTKGDRIINSKEVQDEKQI